MKKMFFLLAIALGACNNQASFEEAVKASLTRQASFEETLPAKDRLEMIKIAKEVFMEGEMPTQKELLIAREMHASCVEAQTPRVAACIAAKEIVTAK